MKGYVWAAVHVDIKPKARIISMYGKNVLENLNNQNGTKVTSLPRRNIKLLSVGFCFSTFFIFIKYLFAMMLLYVTQDVETVNCIYCLIYECQKTAKTGNHSYFRHLSQKLLAVNKSFHILHLVTRSFHANKLYLTKT